jgi:hypothetical protein
VPKRVVLFETCRNKRFPNSRWAEEEDDWFHGHRAVPLLLHQFSHPHLKRLRQFDRHVQARVVAADFQAGNVAPGQAGPLGQRLLRPSLLGPGAA